MLRPLVIVLLLAPRLLAQTPAQTTVQTWSQWGGGPRHTGSIPVYGHTLRELMADVVYDPFVDAERSEGGGALLVHYQTPLSDGNDVFMATKGGSYTGFRTWETQIWSMRKFAVGARGSSWRTGPRRATGIRSPPARRGSSRCSTARWRMDSSTCRAAGGTVLEVDRATGAILRRLGQFGRCSIRRSMSPARSPSATTAILYYNTLKLPATTTPWAVRSQRRLAGEDHARRHGVTRVATARSFRTRRRRGAVHRRVLRFAAPLAAVAQCRGPTTTCGVAARRAQCRAGGRPDGTVYTISRAHLNARWGWLVAVNPDLTPKWASSLRNRFNDGCNVLLPPNGTPGGCRAGRDRRASIRPTTSPAPAWSTTTPPSRRRRARRHDLSTARTRRYNHSQGHMCASPPTGEFLSAYPFGWDVTPALWEHDGTFSLITKENRYVGAGSYCGNPTFCPPDCASPGDDGGLLHHPAQPELERRVARSRAPTR